MQGENIPAGQGAASTVDVATLLKSQLRDVFDQQERYKVLIENQVTNLKKLNKPSRTLDKIEASWQEIKKAWVAFGRNDQQLRELGVTTGPYFETNAKENLKRVVDEGIAFIKRHFPEVVPPEFDNSKTMDLSLLKTPSRGPRRAKSAASLSGIDEDYWEDTVSELTESQPPRPPPTASPVRQFPKSQDPHNLLAGLLSREQSTNKKDMDKLRNDAKESTYTLPPVPPVKRNNTNNNTFLFPSAPQFVHKPPPTTYSLPLVNPPHRQSETKQNFGSTDYTTSSEVEGSKDDPNGNGTQNDRSIEKLIHANQIMLSTVLNGFSTMSQRGSGRISEAAEKVPSYDGRVLIEYKNFKILFDSFINRGNFPKVEKFAVLMRKLQGDAKRLVKHLHISDRNYDKALEMLRDRYEDQKTIMGAEFDAIWSLTPTRPNDYESIRNMNDRIREISYNLETLGYDTETGGAPLVHVILKKMDTQTQLEFERGRDKSVFPTLVGLLAFLDGWYHTLRSITKVYPPNMVRHKIITHLTTDGQDEEESGNVRGSSDIGNDSTRPKSKTLRCLICKESHKTLLCPELKRAEDKVKFLMRRRLCIHCGSHSYDVNNPCRVKEKLKCEICKGQHVTGVHRITNRADYEVQTVANFTKNVTDSSFSETLLPTAIVSVLNTQGASLDIRALVDQCSQSSYVTEECVQRLKLKRLPTRAQIITLGGAVTNQTNKVALVTLKLSDCVLKFKALVVSRISKSLPTNFQHLPWVATEEDLADPSCCKPGPINMLLGANIAANIMEPGVRKKHHYLLQKTKLGWIISGPDSTTRSLHQSNSNFLCLAELEAELKSFWDYPFLDKSPNTEEKEYCETLFTKNHYRIDQRYVAPIPWRLEGPALGGSYLKALGFWVNQEKRLVKDPEHQERFNEFMSEYEKLGHMTEIPSESHCLNTNQVYYIPYFSVLRRDALTTKLRNVFNGSSASDNGVTLNDTIHPGPKLQTSIFSIILQNRGFRFSFGADISKMFRQILLPPQDQKRLRILWRRAPDLPMKEYQLNTVTYGLDCAPWQALRVIHQIADDEAPDPQTAKIIKTSFYVDDLLYGGDTIAECQTLVRQIKDTLQAGKMPLTKWTTNNSAVLSSIPAEERIEAYSKEGNKWKVLGLPYSSTTDSYSINVPEQINPTFTKRGLLSLAASLFDPLGWILPVIMRFRLLLQLLWSAKLGWDDDIPLEMKNLFTSCIQGLPLLKSVKVNRWLGSTSGDHIELVGFCDASFEGYGCSVFSRVKENNKYVVHLLAGKGRVTPLKTKEKDRSLTIPKLELESLVLLTNLISEVKSSLSKFRVSVSAYTDSMVVLHWVRSKNILQDRAVRRRVEIIKREINPVNLHHVKTDENPADAASRGMDPHVFIQHSLWFHGPTWISSDVLPTTKTENPREMHQSSDISTFSTLSISDNQVPWSRFSSYQRLIRVLTYCRRWLTKKAGALGVQELGETEVCLLKQEQHRLLGSEINILMKKKPWPKGHYLIWADPYLDEEGVMRMGGRLRNALLEENRKHPIILAKLSLLTKLIVRDAHYSHLHAGPVLMESIVRERFWVPSLKQLIKKEFRSCVRCIRCKGKTMTQVMADLPIQRVNSCPIFSHVGVDLAGPVLLKASPLRTASVMKHWIALFICLATKLVHLELLPSLSTKTFLEAFTRFVSRRGMPESLLSDNGSNFIGADRALKATWHEIAGDCKNQLALKGIKWTFIPSLSPTFGGIWEANVKTMKVFLKRTQNNGHIVYDEYYTVLCKIEALMNSRPLCPLTDDPNEIAALTPAHFVIQRSLLFPPLPSEPGPRPSVSKRWVHLQAVLVEFWDIFKKQYLSCLQARRKWTQQRRNPQVDELVVLKDDGAPIEKWKLGRITATHPDKRGIVRKVDVRSGTGYVSTRGVNTLVELPPLRNSDTRPVSPSDDPPSPRVTRRRKPLGFVTSSMLLLFLIQLVSGSIIPLYQPINILKLRDVEVRALDISFSIQTPINYTDDSDNLDEQLEIVREVCLQHSGNKEVKHRCNRIQRSLNLDVEAAKTHLASLVNSGSRPKRWVPAVIAGISQVVTMVGMGYGFYRLNEENKDLKSKIEKISKVLLNTTNVAFDNLDFKLNEVIEAQNTLQILGELEYMTDTIQLCIQNKIALYDNLSTFTPIVQLASFVEDLETKLTGVRLPSLDPETLFSLNPSHRYTMNGTVWVSFVIPLVEVAPYQDYAIILNPDKVNYTLSSHTFSTRVIANSKNNTYIETDETNKLPFETNFSKRRINFCELNILEGKIPNCPRRPTMTWSSGVEHLHQNLYVFYKQADTGSAETTCNGTSQPLVNGTFLIKLQNCTLTTNEFTLSNSSESVVLKTTTLMNNSHSDWKDDIHLISPIKKPDELFHAVSDYISTVFEDDPSESWWVDTWTSLKSWVVGYSQWLVSGVMFLLLLFIIWCSCSRRPSPEAKVSGIFSSHLRD